MARSGSNGRPRRGDGGRGRRVVLAGRGDGWDLWVPADVWAGLSDQERADLAERQAALLKGGLSPARGPRRPARVASV